MKVTKALTDKKLHTVYIHSKIFFSKLTDYATVNHSQLSQCWLYLFHLTEFPYLFGSYKSVLKPTIAYTTYNNLEN